MTELERRAILWWESKRPVDWSEDKHVAHPMANCATEEERLLAFSAADRVKK